MDEIPNLLDMESYTTNAVDAPESTSSPTEWTKVLPVEAMNHLVQGKRHLLVQDYSSAAASLQEACEQFVKFYGQTANECGEVHFYYGKALLELARQETGVFGDALPGGSDEEESKDDTDNASDDEANAEGEDDEEDEEEGLGDSENNNDEMNEATEPDSGNHDIEVEIKPSSSSGDTNNEAGPSSSVGGSTEKEEDVSTLQLSWEVLETAKLIFKRQASEDPNVKLRMAEILLALGEISMESENYMAAIEDLQECLNIHQRYLNADDRLLAETYYQLGLAYVFDNQYQEGQNSFQNSVDTIKLRISTLKTQVKPSQISDFGAKDPEKEINELEALLPDLQAKVEDTEELIESTRKNMAEAFQKSLQQNEDSFRSSSEASNFSTVAKPVNNISHLLKRKKPDDQDNKTLLEAKKLKMSLPMTNGSSDG